MWWKGETYGGSGAGHEDQRSEVGGALVRQSSGGVDEGTDSVGLHGGSDDGCTPGGRRRGGLLGLDEFLGGVGALGTVVRVAENGAENGEGGGVVEERAEGDGRRLHGGEV